MKNFMVANFRNSKRYNEDKFMTMIKAQIENSLELGWKTDDIIILSNVEFGYMGVKSIKIELNNFCFTGSKMFGLKWLYDNNMVSDTIWSHDTDAWQNVWFDEPEFKDVGAAEYSRPKYNGGSIFWKPEAKDICFKIVEELTKNQENKEEPTINRLLKNEFKNRTTTLNYTYNVGCSGYFERSTKSIKPIKVCHFHPTNRIAWETHVLDRNGLNEIGITPRLEKILRKYYQGLATELSEEGKKRRKEKIEERFKKGKRNKC